MRISIAVCYNRDAALPGGFSDACFHSGLCASATLMCAPSSSEASKTVVHHPQTLSHPCEGALLWHSGHFPALRI